MTILNKAIEAYVHNYGQYYEREDDCIQKMILLYYAKSDLKWQVDPEELKKEGHIVVPETEWKNYDHRPCAIFYEEDDSEGRVYAKYIFHLILKEV